MRTLLNVLALNLSPQGSAAILETQVAELCRRFRKFAEEATGRVGATPGNVRISRIGEASGDSKKCESGLSGLLF